MEGKPKNVDECFEHYCQWIEERFTTINASHFAPCLAAPQTLTTSPKVPNKVVMYKFLATMADCIINRDCLTLQELIDEQHYQGHFDAKHEATKRLLTQMIFMAFGWLTMLYDPEVAPTTQEDQLSLSRQTRVSKRAFNTHIFLTYEQDFRTVQQPLSLLLRVFGNVVPLAEDMATDFSHLLASPTTNGPNFNSEYLILSYLSYSTLSRIAQIKIEWVDSVNLHLDFDEGRRLLKLFRFPSFCRLAYPAKGRKTFLHR